MGDFGKIIISKLANPEYAKAYIEAVNSVYAAYDKELQALRQENERLKKIIEDNEYGVWVEGC